MRPNRPKSLTQLRIRGVYAGAWTRSLGATITPELSQKLAEILKEEVVKAAKAEARSLASSPTNKVTLPNNENFFRSFTTRVLGDRTVEVRSHYPMIASLVEGREPYPMTWLTTANGVGKVPIERPDGTVIFRVPPNNSNKAWIHPGFVKHKFITVAIKNARARFVEVVEAAVAGAINKGKVKF